MAKQTALASQVEPAARRLAEQLGFELVDVELVRENTGRFLRFYIDKPEGITLNDCELYHRRIQPLMEQVDYDYMEVSSPGADRPLKKPEDFMRAQGGVVEAHLYRPLNGVKRYVGELVGLVDGQIVLLAGDQEISLDKRLVSLVKPVLEFDEEDLQDESEPPD